VLLEGELREIVATWASTVFTAIESRSATDRFERPSATSASTPRSRGVRTAKRSWVVRLRTIDVPRGSGDVAVAFGSVWATSEHGSVIRLDPQP
jgi:hypothetical protein